MSNDKYILPHLGEALTSTSRELYGKAMEQLAIPFPSSRTGIFKEFDKATGGFRAREYSILCGPSGLGKTTLLANLSAALLDQGVIHYVASVETGAIDFEKRLMCVYAKKDLNDGEAVPVDELKEVHKKIQDKLVHEKLFLGLHETRIEIEELLHDIAWLVKHKGIKVAMIDNLNFFMKVTNAKDSLTEMDRVTHEIVEFCKVVDVHILMIMHARKAESQRIDSMGDVKGSSTATQEAHNVFLFNHAHPELIKAEKAVDGDREITIAKMRRRGKYVGSRIILRSFDTVSYFEGGMFYGQR